METPDLYREIQALSGNLLEHGRPELAEKILSAEIEGGTALEALAILRDRLSEILKDNSVPPLLLRRISKIRSEIDKVFE